MLLSIQGGSDLGLFEINEAARLVQEAAHPEANIIFGAVIDDALGDEVRVTVIAAGFDGGAPAQRARRPRARPGPGRVRRPHRAPRRPRPPRRTADRRLRRPAVRPGRPAEGPPPAGAPAAAEPAAEPEQVVVVPDRSSRCGRAPAARWSSTTNDDLDVPDFLK